MKNTKTKGIELIELDVKESLKNLLKNKMCGCFEREPVPAFAEGNLNNLITEINKLYG